MTSWALVASSVVSAIGTVVSAYVAAKARDTNRRLRQFHDDWGHNGY